MSAISKRLEKAARLVVDDAVREVELARTFYIKGDSDTYLVTLVIEGPRKHTGRIPGSSSCSCEWGRARAKNTELPHCSHVLAARAFVDRETPRDVFARFDTE